MTPHRWADVLVAIAEGRAVQWQKYNLCEWIDYRHSGPINPIVDVDAAWRVKPEPREPRRIWVNEYRDGFQGICANNSKALADETASTNRISCVEFIEVIPKEEQT